MKTLCSIVLLSLLVAAPAWAQRKTTPASPDQQAKVTIVEESSRIETTGFVKILGRVKNGTDKWIAAPRIDVDLLDSSKKTLRIDSFNIDAEKDVGATHPKDFAYPDQEAIAPGGFVVFEYMRDVAKVGGTVVSHTLMLGPVLVLADPVPQLAAEGITTAKPNPKPGLAVGDDDFWIVKGKLHNIGKADCRSPKAVVGVYGKDGKLFEVRTEQPDEYFQKMLPPGGSVEFKHKVPPDLKPAKFEVWATCTSE